MNFCLISGETMVLHEYCKTAWNIMLVGKNPFTDTLCRESQCKTHRRVEQKYWLQSDILLYIYMAMLNCQQTCNWVASRFETEFVFKTMTFNWHLTNCYRDKIMATMPCNLKSWNTYIAQINLKKIVWNNTVNLWHVFTLKWQMKI